VKGTTQVLFPGMGRLLENCVLSIKNKSHSVTAGIVVPEDDATGVIICQGANIGGWSLYAHEGKLKYCYNYGGFGNTFVDVLTRSSALVSTRFAWSLPTKVKAWQGRDSKPVCRR
jgi:arylsulfatase